MFWGDEVKPTGLHLASISSTEVAWLGLAGYLWSAAALPSALT